MNELYKAGGIKRKITFLVSLFLLVQIPGFTAPKKKSKTKNNKDTETVAEQNSETSEHGTKLPSKAKTRTYFYKIDESIVSGVENGSPESIKLAVSKLRKSDGEYAENEKVLMSVAAEIMQIVWPSEKSNLEPFDEVEDNSYTGSINSAKNGIFDSSTGNVDFLSTTLPVLVILTQNISSNVYEQCEPSVRAALELNPDSLLINYLAGVLYKQKGDYLNSEKYLQLAYEKSGNVLEVILAYSDVLILNKKTAVAVQVMASVPAEQGQKFLL